jgi:hypothetical protein
VDFTRDGFLPKNRTVDSVFEAGIDSSNSGKRADILTGLLLAIVLYRMQAEAVRVVE